MIHYDVFILEQTFDNSEIIILIYEILNEFSRKYEKFNKFVLVFWYTISYAAADLHQLQGPEPESYAYLAR